MTHGQARAAVLTPPSRSSPHPTSLRLLANREHLDRTGSTCLSRRLSRLKTASRASRCSSSPAFRRYPRSAQGLRSHQPAPARRAATQSSGRPSELEGPWSVRGSPPPPPPPPPKGFWESTADWVIEHPRTTAGITVGFVGAGLLAGYAHPWFRRTRVGARKHAAASAERRQVVGEYPSTGNMLAVGSLRTACQACGLVSESSKGHIPDTCECTRRKASRWRG